jgi:TonB family protein
MRCVIFALAAGLALGQATITQQVARKLLVKEVTPVYPPIAIQAKVQGTVAIAITVDENGKVTSTQVTSGPALLRQAGVDAVAQYVFRPMMLNGQPTAFKSFIEIPFQLP